MHVIALTGTVAAGKSSVAALFRAWGATVIDADTIVRALQIPGEPVFDAIMTRFGDGVRAPDGTLNREALRRLMLADGTARKDLEAIVHPAVEARRGVLLDAARARGDALVIAEVPLLFEAANPAAYEGIIVVDAPPAERKRRLVANRGLDSADADRLSAAQWPASKKRERATWVIDNDGDRQVLETRARAVWEQLPR